MTESDCKELRKLFEFREIAYAKSADFFDQNQKDIERFPNGPHQEMYSKIGKIAKDADTALFQKLRAVFQ